MASLYTHRETNIRKTFLLFSAFLVLVIGIGWVFAQAYGAPEILYFAAIFSIVTSLISYWSSDKIAIAMSGARPITREENPMLYNIIENLTMTAGLPMPRVYITPERQINAFATGRNPKHAAVAVTVGALERLSKPELEGVLAHELSHIGNRDILVSTIAVVLAGIISMLSDFFTRSLFFGGLNSDDDRGGKGNGIFLIIGIAVSILAPLGAMLMQLAISRRREFLADTSGVLLTRYPEGLASALEKIAQDSQPMARAAHDSTAHLWISNPFKGKRVGFIHKLFMTHPPIAERIAALRRVNIENPEA
jgi:heat shock protein HtpX